MNTMNIMITMPDYYEYYEYYDYHAWLLWLLWILWLPCLVTMNTMEIMITMPGYYEYHVWLRWIPPCQITIITMSGYHDCQQTIDATWYFYSSWAQQWAAKCHHVVFPIYIMNCEIPHPKNSRTMNFISFLFT